MKKRLLSYLNALFGRELELRVKLFHVLAITGFIICVIMTGVSIGGRMWPSMFINIGAGLVSLFLLIYSARKQKYKLCYGLSIAVIFFILFPSLFFYGGGYKGGMPFFFIFAAVFTVYMLDGWSVLVVTLAELIFYSWLCVVAFRHPEYVVPFQSEEAVVTDVVVGLITVGISLGVTMFAQVSLYRRQQKELEKARKAAEAASQAKSAFLANMSHEIRTPIHLILGMNEILHRESRDPQVAEYSEKIQETSQMLLSLVDSVLDVSKIESGKMEVIPAVYESRDLAGNLELIGRSSCQKKGLEFQCRVAPDLPPRLYGDMAHIRQIGANFLSNAAKYTKKGMVTLEISQEPVPDEKKIMLCLSVTDTGIGIRPQAQASLFDAFSRADLASHRDIEGTGLGLAIVRELTHLMGGTVSLRSQVGKGSTFTVHLPQQIPDADTVETDAPRMTFRAPQARVLVVDDNEGNLMVMEKLLSPTRVRVDTAASGRSCLEKTEKQAYDLILMDYMMPEMDGLETVRRLRSRPDFHTPVIALTADATPETREKLTQAGISCYLTKPVPWSRLRDAMLAALPGELVTVVPEESHPKDDPETTRLAAMLEPFGVNLTDGLSYFDGDLNKYLTVAALFVRRDEAERRKVEALWKEKDYPSLRFPIHSLKGKARNLGMLHLAQVCVYGEKLCTEGRPQALDSILPHLFYLWEQGSKGIAELLKEKKPFRQSEAVPEEGAEEHLPELLHQFRRKPSLACIGVLLRQEESPEGRQKLTELRKLVEDIDFRQAEEKFRAYLSWKQGGKTK